MESGEPIILDSARKWGVDDEDMLHALRNYIRLYAMDEGFTMVTAPAGTRNCWRSASSSPLMATCS